MYALADLDQWGLWLAAVGGGFVVLVGAVRWARPRVRAVTRDSRAIRDTLVGREAQYDSITGREIAPALPSIGQRMADSDERLDRLTAVVETIADSHVRIDALETRVTRIESIREIERALGKVESIQLMQTMESAIKADPGDTSE